LSGHLCKGQRAKRRAAPAAAPAHGYRARPLERALTLAHGAAAVDQEAHRQLAAARRGGRLRLRLRLRLLLVLLGPRRRRGGRARRGRRRAGDLAGA
jgi:hypothetical protein